MRIKQIDKEEKRQKSQQSYLLTLFALIFVYSQTQSSVYAQPCSFRKQPYPVDFLFTNTRETTKQMKTYYYLEGSKNPSGDNLLYLLKNNGAQAIFNVDKSTIINSYTIQNVVELTAAWDFQITQNILYHIVDTQGNVYEVDGNYGRQIQQFKKTTVSSVPINNNLCLSIKHSTYVTWSTNIIYFVKYREDPSSQNRVITKSVEEFIGISIKGCQILEDQDTVLIFTNKQIKILKYNLENPVQIIEYELKDVAFDLNQFGQMNGYRYFHYNTAVDNYVLSVVKDKAEVFNLITNVKILTIYIDSMNNRVLYTDANGYAYILNISDKTQVKKFDFLDISINFDESSTYPGVINNAYIASLAINQINIFTNEDLLVFQGSAAFFVYRLSTLEAIYFKQTTLASTSILNFFPFQEYLVIIGNVQVTYLSLNTNKINQLNFIGQTITVDNNKYLNLFINFPTDRIIVTTQNNQLLYFQLSTLTFEKLVFNSNLDSVAFDALISINRLIAFVKYSTKNSSGGAEKNQVNVYEYSSGNLLYKTTFSVQIQDYISDSTKTESFFIMRTTTIIHKRYTAGATDSPTLVTYLVPNYSAIVMLLVESSKKLVVSTNVGVFIYDYSDPVNNPQPSPVLSYPVATYPTVKAAYNVIFGYIGNQIFGYSSGTALKFLSLNSPNATNDITFTGMTLMDKFDKDEANNSLIAGYWIGANYYVTVVDYTTFTKTKEILLTQLERSSDLALDTARKEIVVIGTLGTVFTLDYTLATLPVKKQITTFSSEVVATFIDKTNLLVNVFYKDGTYIKTNYSTGYVIKTQNLNSAVQKIWVHPDMNTLTVVFPSSFLQLSYQEKQSIRYTPAFLQNINKFYEDPERNIILVISNKNLFIYSMLENNKLLKTITISGQGYMFSDIKVSKKWDLLILPTRALAFYTLRYSDFSNQKMYTNALKDDTYYNLGIELDESGSRLFMFCRYGSITVWKYNNQTNIFENPIAKQDYLGSSALSGISIFPEAKLVFIGSLSWWGKMLNYDSLEQVFSDIPGHYGYFAKQFNYLVVYDQNGAIWIYNALNYQIVFTRTVHTGFVRFVILTQEEGFTVPTIISGSDDKNLYVIRNFDYDNRKIYLHDSELTLGILDEKSQLIFTGDKKGRGQVFTFPALTLKFQYSAPYTAIGGAYPSQLVLIPSFNQLLWMQAEGSFTSLDFYNVIQPEYIRVLSGQYGINEVIQVEDKIYQTDSVGLLSRWDITNNQMKYMSYQKRDFMEYTKSKLKKQVNKNVGLALYAKQFQKIDFTTNEVTSSPPVFCISYDYYEEVDLIGCIYMNTVTFYDTNFNLVKAITIAAPTTSTIIKIDFVIQFKHVFISQTNGDLSVYTYDSLITTFTYLTVINAPNTNNCRLGQKIIDPTNALIIVSYYNGKVVKFDYAVDSILNQTDLTIVSYSSSTLVVAVLKVISNKYLLLRRNTESNVIVYSYPQLVPLRIDGTTDSVIDGDVRRPFLLRSPCTGMDTSVDIDMNYNMFVISCNGQYHLYSTEDLSFLGSCREIYKITSKYEQYQTKRTSTLKFINDSFFIDSFYKTLFIFQIDKVDKKIHLIGSYHNSDSVNRIGDINLIQKTDGSGGVYGATVAIFSYLAIEQLVIPLFPSDVCKFETTAQLFSRSLSDLEEMYTQLNSFSKVNKFRLVIKVSEGINLPLFPSFVYSSQSQIMFAPVGVDTPPSSDDQKLVRNKVFASPQFFLSASNYAELFMNNLELIFQYNSQISNIYILSKPLKFVNFSYLDINSNVPDQQIQFQSVLTAFISNMKITYRQTGGSFNRRILADSLQAGPSFDQKFFFSFQDILSLQIQSITIEKQKFADLNFFQIVNNGENIALNPQLKSASVLFDDITIKQNEIVTTIPQQLAETQINSFIQVSLIPNIQMNNINILDNFSTSDRIQGIFSLEGSITLDVQNSHFENNNNLFFLYTNTTCGQSDDSDGSSNFEAKKFYQLLNTQINMNTIYLVGNTQTISVKNILRINSDQFKASNLFVKTNNLNYDSKNNNNYSNNLISESALISFIDVLNASIDTMELKDNIKYLDGVIKFQNIAASNIINLTASGNTLSRGTFFVTKSAITIENSSFSMNTASKSAASIYLTETIMKLNTVDFSTETAVSSGGSINMENSKATLNKNTFTSCSSKESQGGAIYASSSQLTILNQSVFSTCTAILQGGAISITSSLFTFTDSKIMLSQSSTYGGALYNEISSLITITNSYFATNTAQEGGAIYSSVSTPSVISNSFFSDNIAYGSGGGIMMINSDLTVQETEFQRNKAGYGGGLRYKGLMPTFLLPISPSQLRSNLDQNGFWVIGTNKFKNNLGYVIGPEIASVFTKILTSINTSNFNFKVFKVDTPYERIQVPNVLDYQYSFENMRSGEKNFKFQIELYDILNQKISPTYATTLPKGFSLSKELQNELDNIRCTIKEIIIPDQKIEEQELSVDGSTIVAYTSNKESDFYGISLDSISLTGIPGGNGKFYLTIEGLQRINTSNIFVASEQINFLVKFRLCERGEIYLPRCVNCLMQQCDICTTGTYSLIQPEPNQGQQCKPCKSQYASSCEGDHIQLLPGYWRENEATDNIYDCDSKYRSCNGEEESHYCAEGFIGALCQSCDQSGSFWKERYSLSSLYSDISCVKCNEISGQQAFQIVFLCLTGVYLFFQLQSINQSSVNYIKGQVIKQLGMYMVQNSLVKYELSVLSKLLIHYMSVQEIINQFTISNKQLNEQVYSVPKEFLVPVSNLFMGFDCYLSDPQGIFSDIPIEYARLLATFIQCLFLLSLIIFFYAAVVLICYKAMKYRLLYIKAHYLSQSAFVGSTLFILYFFQQTLTSTSLKIITCQTVGDKNYILSQMNKECYTEEYFTWFPLLITTFLLSAFVYPLILYVLLHRNKDKLFQTFSYRPFRKYGFLFAEYKKSCWWWEIMKMVERQLIIIMTQLSIFQLLEKVAIILLILFFYLALQLKKQPYKTCRLNQIDYMLNTASIVIIILAIYSHGVENTLQKSILSNLIIVLKFICLGFICLRLIESFLAQQMLAISKSPKLLCLFGLLKGILREKVFSFQNNSLKKNFPSLYLLIHRPSLICIDRHYRWKLFQVAIFEYLKQKKQQPLTDFYEMHNLKNSIIKDESKILKEKSKDCWSKVLLSSIRQLKESQSLGGTTTHKESRFKNGKQLNGTTPNSPAVGNGNLLSNLNRHQSLFDQLDVDRENLGEINTPHGHSKFQTSRYDQFNDYNSKNKLCLNDNTTKVEDSGKTAFALNSVKRVDNQSRSKTEQTDESQSEKFSYDDEKANKQEINQIEMKYLESLAPRKNKF